MSEPIDGIAGKILDFARELIRIPSRAGIDGVDEIVGAARHWSERHHLRGEVLEGPEGQVLGMFVHVPSGRPGPALCLDACLDTAPFGDEQAWRYPPSSAAVDGGRLYGRGAADSKIAGAIFLFLAHVFSDEKSLPCGDLYVLLDADEHTGEFGGVKAFMRCADPRPSAVWIGYPGNNTIVAGSRGFLRARITVYGVSAHTGSKRRKGVNAVSRAARLVVKLEGLQLPAEPDPAFAFGPSLSITAIGGGQGFSVVPDRCELNLDIRLTPSLEASAMQELVGRAVREFDASGGTRPTAVEWEESWPAYRQPDDTPAIASLRTAAQEVFGRVVPTTISGPSNIGNYVASLGVAAMSGFGVTYDNVHATDEWSQVASIAPVFETYRRAIVAYLRSAGAGPHAPGG